MHVYLGKIGERKIHSLNSVDDHFRSIEVAYKGGKDIHIYIYTHICSYCIYIYSFTYICMNMNVCLYVYIFIHMLINEFIYS